MRKGFNGSFNVFTSGMERSLQNAVNIIAYVLARLFLHKGDGAMQLSMYTEMKTPGESFIQKASDKIGDKEIQAIDTEEYESEFKDMSTKLNEFETLVIQVFAINSSEYNKILGRTRNRFYRGSYLDRVGALKAMAKEMNNQGATDAADAVLAYITEIEAKHKEQISLMDRVSADRAAIENLRNTLIKKLYKVYGGLMYIYGDEDNSQQLVDSFFPINLLGERTQFGLYQLIVPSADFRRICIHLFQENEMVEVLAVGSDCWISTADNVISPIASGFMAKDGVSGIIDPKLFGDLSKKIIMATNVNLTSSCDLIFNIIKAKK